MRGMAAHSTVRATRPDLVGRVVHHIGIQGVIMARNCRHPFREKERQSPLPAKIGHGFAAAQMIFLISLLYCWTVHAMTFSMI
jgi:hypothetical protein